MQPFTQLLFLGMIDKVYFENRNLFWWSWRGSYHTHIYTC